MKITENLLVVARGRSHSYIYHQETLTTILKTSFSERLLILSIAHKRIIFQSLFNISMGQPHRRMCLNIFKRTYSRVHLTHRLNRMIF